MCHVIDNCHGTVFREVGAFLPPFNEQPRKIPSCIRLIVGGSASEKGNALLNLMNHESDIDKIYIYIYIYVYVYIYIYIYMLKINMN